MTRKYGQADWIRNFWLNYKPQNWATIRHIFYMNLPDIEKFVPQDVKDKCPKWAFNFYLKMSNYFSEMWQRGEVSYQDLNILPDEACSEYIYQEFKGKRDLIPPDKECRPDYPIEIWIEKNSIFRNLISLFYWANPNKVCKLNVVSGHGWAKGTQIEKLLRERLEVETILHLADFDPAGDAMTEELQERINRGVGKRIPFKLIEVKRVALFEHQVPKSKRKISIVEVKEGDTKAKRFYAKHGKGQMAYELDCLTESELQKIVLEALKNEGVNIR